MAKIRPTSSSPRLACPVTVIGKSPLAALANCNSITLTYPGSSSQGRSAQRMAVHVIRLHPVSWRRSLPNHVSAMPNVVKRLRVRTLTTTSAKWPPTKGLTR